MPYKDPIKAKENARERVKRYREKHPERIAAYYKRPEVKVRMSEWAANKLKKDPIHSEKRRAQWREWNKRNKEYRDEYGYKRRYGITWEERDALLAKQGGCCAICKADNPQSKRAGWHTDHCHTTGKIRGMLCYKCNILLGLANDNLLTLQAAIDYLGKLTAP